MSAADEPFTAGYLAGCDHRADTAAEGDWSPDDGHLVCPQQHPEPDPSCDWCGGWAAAWE
ncbi:MAG: hypothetical protein H6523_13000 [Mycolicibacterium sp.]|nr:hypothetical protein [Mycolicibacterium sp.]